MTVIIFLEHCRCVHYETYRGIMRQLCLKVDYFIIDYGKVHMSRVAGTL